MLDVAFVYGSNSIYAIWKNRIFSKRTRHGILKLGMFHRWLCWKVSPVEKSLGNFFPAEIQLRTRVRIRGLELRNEAIELSKAKKGSIKPLVFSVCQNNCIEFKT